MGKWFIGIVLAGVTLLAQGETLRFGFGTEKPPYVFEAEQRGLEVEIIAAASELSQVEVSTLHYHN